MFLWTVVLNENNTSFKINYKLIFKGTLVCFFSFKSSFIGNILSRLLNCILLWLSFNHSDPNKSLAGI